MKERNSWVIFTVKYSGHFLNWTKDKVCSGNKDLDDNG